MSAATTHHQHDEKTGPCLQVGELRRLNYFYGQMLSAQDFQTEQNFFREKLKLHNRCLHGYGTVCGLLVEPVPMPRECPTPEDRQEKELRDALRALLEQKRAWQAAPQGPAAAPGAAGKGTAQPAIPTVEAPSSPQTAPGAPGPVSPPPDLDAQIAAARKKLEEFYKEHCRKEPRTHFRITCGLALDCEGNELVLRHDLAVDPLSRMSNEDYNQLRQGAADIYVSLCYCEEPVDPVRPVLPDMCGASSGCEFSKTQSSVRVEVRTQPPEPDERCETCCECCHEPCVLLAKIEFFVPGDPLDKAQIHNEVRRPISPYQPTTITGISWEHGHTYTQEEAKRILGTDRDETGPPGGLEIRFSRGVRASTIQRGVMDVWVIEGGRGRSADIYHKSGEFVDKPESGYADRIRYRDTTGETLEPGDRVLIILRTNFILDRCCRPVDGEHVGGKVPRLPGYEPQPGASSQPEECIEPPGRPGPWTSGNGTPGGTFESWFYVREDERVLKRAK